MEKQTFPNHLSEGKGHVSERTNRTRRIYYELPLSRLFHIKACTVSMFLSILSNKSFHFDYFNASYGFMFSPKELMTMEQLPEENLKKWFKVNWIFQIKLFLPVFDVAAFECFYSLRLTRLSRTTCPNSVIKKIDQSCPKKKPFKQHRKTHSQLKITLIVFFLSLFVLLEHQTTRNTSRAIGSPSEQTTNYFCFIIWNWTRL